MTYSIIQKSQLEEAVRIDAEYFELSYLELASKIEKFGYQSITKLGCRVVSGPFGSSLKSDSYLNNGVPFLRINDLREFFINADSMIYISEKDNNRLKQSELHSGDLILSKVGNTIGIVSTVPSYFSKCNISENNIGIKFPIDIAPSYKPFILTFFNSKIGLSQVLRSVSGNAQPKINIADIQNIIFPIPSETMLEIIKNLVISSETAIRESVVFYKEAQNLLLEEVGLKDFKIPEDLSYIINYSDTEKVDRVDADYFQPKYQIISEKIKTNNAKPLGNLVTFKKGFEPGSEAYQEEGKLFIRVSSLSKYGVEAKDQKYLSDELYQKLRLDYEPKVGEILLTKDATPGISYVVKESIEGIISTGILRLKLKSDIEPEYLSLCISSLIGQMQAERDAGGSIIIHWKPEQIKNILIPVLPKSMQKKIANLVKKSHDARKKSKALLEEAKRKVEQMIEKGDKE